MRRFALTDCKHYACVALTITLGPWHFCGTTSFETAYLPFCLPTTYSNFTSATPSLSPLPDHAIAGPEHIVVADVAAGCVVVTLSQSHSLQVLVPVQSPSGSSSGRRHSGSGSAEPATSAAEAAEAYGGAHTAGGSRHASTASRPSAPAASGTPWVHADTGAAPGVPPGRASTGQAPGPGVGAAAQHAPGPGSRKRARQGCRLELAGVVPLSEEVSCLQVRG